MAKRLISLLSVLLISSSLFSVVIFTDEESESERSFLRYAFEVAIDKRKDVDVIITSFTQDEERILLSFTIEEKPFSISARDGDELIRFLSNALYQEDLLYLDGDIVDYAYERINASDESYRYASMLYIRDRDGDVRGIAQAKRDGNITILKPFYSKDIKPGYQITEGPSWALTASVSSPLLRLAFDCSISLRYMSLVRNLYPYVLFDYIYDRGESKFYGGFGLEVRASLASLFNTNFTMLEDGAIFGSMEVLLGHDDGFSWGMGFSVGYEHFPVGNFFYRIGYHYNTIVGHEMLLGAGVLF